MVGEASTVFLIQVLQLCSYQLTTPPCLHPTIGSTFMTRAIAVVCCFRKKCLNVARKAQLVIELERIYGDRASLFWTILACTFHSNKLPIGRKRYAGSSILSDSSGTPPKRVTSSVYSFSEGNSTPIRCPRRRHLYR